jgi:hypothetical protein
MSALRISRVALRVRSAVAIKPVQRRSYADAVSDKIKLSLALPHQVSLHLERTWHGAGKMTMNR